MCCALLCCAFYRLCCKKKVVIPDDAKRVAIILNHTKFKTEYPDRLDTDRDVKKLKSVLREYGFHCLVYNDLTAKKIMNLRTDLQKKNDFSNIDSLLVFVLSYGSSSNYTEAFDQSYNLLSFVNEFSPTVFQEMGDKPKLFFICTSRNTEKDYTDSEVVHGIERNTLYNNLALLYGINGTHFIQTFVETSEQLTQDETQNKLDIIDFHQILNNSLKQRSSTGNGNLEKQVVQIYNALQEPYYFEKTE